MRLRALLNLTLLEQAAISASNFLLVVFCARRLEAMDLAAVGYVFATQAFAYMVASTLVYHAGFSDPRVLEHQGYRARLGRVNLSVAMALGAVAPTINWLASDALGWRFEPGLAVLVGAGVVSALQLEFGRRMQQTARSSTGATTRSSIVTCAYLVRVPLVLVLDPTYGAFLSAWALPLVVGACLTWSLIDRTSEESASIESRESMVRLMISHLLKTRYVVATGPLLWVCSSLPLLLLGAIAGGAQVGVLVAVRSLVNIANPLLEVMEVRLAPRFVHHHASMPDSAVRLRRELLLAIVACWVVGAAVLGFVGRQILAGLLGEAYEGFVMLAQLLWLSIAALAAYRVLAMDARARGRSREVFWALFAGAGLTVFFAVPLIARFGVLGSATCFVMWAAVSGLALGVRLGVDVERRVDDQ